MKQEISKKKVITSIGFLYWINEKLDLRGLRDVKITEYDKKLAELKVEYSSKYPEGLTGW